MGVVGTPGNFDLRTKLFWLGNDVTIILSVAMKDWKLMTLSGGGWWEKSSLGRHRGQIQFLVSGGRSSVVRKVAARFDRALLESRSEDSSMDGYRKNCVNCLSPKLKMAQTHLKSHQTCTYITHNG